MALSRIGCSADLTALFVKCSYAGSSATRPIGVKLHLGEARHYPEAPRLQLPSNLSQVLNTETSGFGPDRSRDINAPLALYGSGLRHKAEPLHLDSRLDSYDCFGTVSLNSAMQSNVPKPFQAWTHSTYLNMPGGQWTRASKYLAESMQKSHYVVCRDEAAAFILHGLDKSARRYSTTTNIDGRNPASTESNKETEGNKQQPPILTKKERFRIVVRDYGRTVLVFHIAISLLSLGTVYTLISSGVDFTPFVKLFSSGTEKEEDIISSIFSQGSIFLVAYSIHKMLAPIRLSISLGCTPILVKYLRKKGILRPPKNLSTLK